jgi:hypothetical protein
MRRVLSGVARWVGGATPQSRLVLIAAGCIGLAAIPLQSLDRVPDLCLWERLFGLCPAHGTLHALTALMHGQPALAVSYNPCVLVIAPLLVVLVALDIRRLATRTGRQSV